MLKINNLCLLSLISKEICFKTHTRVPYITRESSNFAPNFMGLPLKNTHFLTIKIIRIMRKLFLLIPALALTLLANATAPTITIDGDKSDWAEVPMLSQPGNWPMLKVLPAADANIGENALVFMLENSTAMDLWSKYPGSYIDTDNDPSTKPADSWTYGDMGIDFSCTIGKDPGTGWVDFPKAKSEDNTMLELGIPSSILTNLGSTFAIGMFYGTGSSQEWFLPTRSGSANPEVSGNKGFVYKTRSFTAIPATLTTANVFAHQSIGECVDYVDFGLRDNGNDTARWAAFPIELTQPALYDVTTNVTTEDRSYKFEFWLVDVATNAVVAHIPAPESSVSSSKTSYFCGTLDLRNVPAGKYMLKVKNRKEHSLVKLNNIEIAYAGGYTVNIPSTLGIADAVITNGKRQDGAIKFDNALTGTAEWKVSVASDAYMNISTTIKNQYGHNISIAVYEEDGVTLVDQVSEGDNKYTNNTEGLLIELGGMYLKAGNYVVKYSNATDGSDAKLVNIAFTYGGGNVQAMPGTTNIADAWFSSNGTRADGKISYSSVNSGCWAKWNINVTAAGNYIITVNISGQYGHDYSVEFLKEGETTPIVVTKNATNYDNDATLYANELGSVILEAANYEMKVYNNVGDAALHSVKLEYAGGGVQNMPGTTELMEAWFSSNGTRNNGAIEYTSVNSGCWAKWNIALAKGGNYNVTVNIRGQYGHDYSVEFLKEGETTPIVLTKNTTNYDNDATLYANELGLVSLEPGNYEMKVSNAVGDAALISVEMEYLGGARITLPATFDFTDGLLSEKAHVTGGNLWFNEIGDSDPLGQWAKWNVKVDAAGTFLFTMNVSSTNSQSYKISILDGETVVDAFESGSLGSGDKDTHHYFNLAAGNYTVKLENMTYYSQGHIVSLVVTAPSLLTLDEMAETNAVIHDNYRNGTHDIKVLRTIVAGMYNTICLPFDVSDSKLKAIFGSDVELKQMSSAELSGDVLNLIFEDVTTGIYRGTPYLIKTSSDVANPVFEGVEIKEEEGQATGSTNADFIGTFIKGEVPAGENNLFLGPNNTLYFSQTATPIKGMRAWFQVKGVPNAIQAIKRANIVTSGQVITSVDFVKDANNGTLKTIENGQVIIIRDGVRYNVMGVKIQ